MTRGKHARAAQAKPFFRIAIRLAWRDVRTSRAKFLLIIVTTAIAIAIVTAVLSLSETVRRELVLGARQWLAADVQVRGNHAAEASQLEALRHEGWEATEVIETAGPISSADGSRYQMSGIKAVDPSVYPFYGELTLSPRLTLARLLGEDSAIVSPDVLQKLDLRVGDTILVSGAEFRITGTIENEPDRFAVMPLALMRVLLSREGFGRTGMMQRGSSAIHRLLIRVPEAQDPGEVSRRLTALFPFEEVIDYKKNAAGVAGIEEQASLYFSFLAFMILIVVSLGTGLLMHTHVQERIETIAIMKLIGATNSQVMRIHFLQIAATSTAGACLGFVLGVWAEHLFPRLLGPYLPFSIASAIPFRAAAEGFVAGVLVPLLLGASPLLSIRRMRPNVLLRRNLETDAFSRRQNLLFLGFAVAGAAGVAAVASGAKPGVTGLMIAGLVAGLIVFTLAALALRSAIPKLLAPLRRFVSASVRYGLLNLSRPGNPLSSIVIALGLGVCFVYVAYLMEGSLLDQLMQYSPFHGAGIYLLNVGPSQKEEVLNFVRSCPDVGRADLDPFVVLRLIAINGNSHIAELRRTWFAAISSSKPASVEVWSGKWWSESDPSSWIALSSRAARAMSAHVGDTLTFSNGTELVKVRVAAVHRGSSADALRYHLTLSPGAVSESRVTYNGAVWIAPSAVAEFQRQVRARYPSILVMNQADIASVIQDTAGHVASVLRLISSVSLTGGVIILSAGLFAMRIQRSREISILKSLGATRRTIVLSLLSEFTMLGIFAAALGIAMGSGLSNLLGRYAFDPPLPPFQGWTAASLTVAVTVAMTNVAGLASGLSLLGQKPSEILRGEPS